MEVSDLSEQAQAVGIIGMSGRFPGADNVGQFWSNLIDGRVSISFFTEEELLSSGIGEDVIKDPQYIRAKGVISDIESFDAGFFGFTSREAEITDPQHRLFLECAWEAFELAGYHPEAYPGRIAVFAGSSMSSYLFRIYSQPELVRAIGDYRILLGNEKDFLPAWVAYKLNLKGPSVSVQTACSTSLVAVHMACQSLISGECDMALAGGVAVGVPHKTGYYYREGGIHAPDGTCRPFDAGAMGTVAGNGVGVVILKRLADAVADRDSIIAVIKGSAVNNDGSSKVGFTAPSINGQAQVIADALSVAGVSPETINFIEAHGTGTVLGDPIEISALHQVFREWTSKKHFCALGSVKANIGHLDIAAGVAGLIKAAISLKRRRLPPSVNFEKPNPKIDFENSPFFVAAKQLELRPGKTPLRAGISSFGIGGTNAHVILEEAPPRPRSEVSRPWRLLVLSAKKQTALDRSTADLTAFLKSHPDVDPADLAYTLQVGRKPFAYRRMLVYHNCDEILKNLEPEPSNEVGTQLIHSKEKQIVFLFPGQGAQFVNMTREIYLTERSFTFTVDHCSELLKPYLNLDLRDLLYPGEADKTDSAKKLNQTYITQPAIFVVEYALAKLWMKWGIGAGAMMGHSIGEYVAACLAGVFSLEDALRLVAIRGRLMQSMPQGAMLAVSLREAEISGLVGDELSLAAINAPGQCVVSGPLDEIEECRKLLVSKGINCLKLQTSHAYHSKMMEPVLEPFLESVKKVRLNEPSIPYISNVTGDYITASEATDHNYWVKHLRQTVRFADGLERLLKDPDAIFLEVGPGKALTTLAKQRQLNKSTNQIFLLTLPSPQENRSEMRHLLNTLGRFWLEGAPVDWAGFHLDEQLYRIPLTTYPFERKRYWINHR